MIVTSLTEIAKKINGKIIGEDFKVSNIFTDSRQKKTSGLFVALKGPCFDAHDFVNEAIASGANSLIVDHFCEVKTTQIIVENTRDALANIARINRNKSKAKYIAITGSSGKTTVKEMIASILQLSGKTIATQENLNNDIGVPLTLSAVEKDTEFAVIELGANHHGEIAYTADITCPDVALVNNVSAAHLEGFGDLQGVANAKSEIYSALKDNGIALVNQDDAFFDFFQTKIKTKQLSYSILGTADVMAKNIQLSEQQAATFDLIHQQQKINIKLPIVGLHNVSNALAAASCCIAIGIPLTLISQGLEATPAIPGRLIISKSASGCRVINDTYNANMASMKAAIELLKNYPAPRILVLGDMAELGELAQDCHQQIGEYAKRSGIEQLYTCGVLTQFSQRTFSGIDFIQGESQSNSANHSNNITGEISHQKSEHFNQQKELVIKLKQEAIAGATILIKGSRSAHMENVVQALLQDLKENNSISGYSSNENMSAASLHGEN